jgi:hypothetical protein
MIAYLDCPMIQAATDRSQGVRNRPAGGGKVGRKGKRSKKDAILTERSEDSVEKTGVSVFGLKTNSISRAKNVNQSEKHGQKSTIFRALSEAGNWKLEIGN